MSADPFAPVNQYLSACGYISQPDWLPFAGGSSNRLYRAVIDDAHVVLRLNAPVSRAFGVERLREAAILQRISGQSWAPEVIRNAPAEGWLLMRWHGERCALPLSTELQRTLLEQVAQWQQITDGDPAMAIDYTALFEAFRPQVSSLPMEQPLLALIDGAHKALALLPELPQGIVHHDLHPGNLCLHEGKLVVVDWEYGAIGNSWFDLAALRLHFGIEPSRLAMLPVVAPLGPAALEPGLQRAVWLLQVLETLWYWTRGLTATEITLQQLMTRTVQLLKQ